MTVKKLSTILLFICFLAASAHGGTEIFSKSNLVAWCIVPFDAQKRGPEERAKMLQRLGISRLAYDWRDEHIPTFDAEITAMKRQRIELTAWWVPGALNSTTRNILQTLERHNIKPQLWVLIGEPLPGSNDQAAKAKAAANELKPLVVEAARIGCKVGLYNHGGWFGEPENQIAIIKELGLPNVGIVYNFHHGHEHIDRFERLFALMQPHLLALNINGMVKNGDKQGKKILQVGDGDKELELMRVAAASGWQGPVGIIDHREETDSELTLRGNLEGLKRLIPDAR